MPRLGRNFRRGTRRLSWGRPAAGAGGGLPAGALLDLDVLRDDTYQTRTANTTPAGVGDPVRRVVASTGQVFTVAADDDAATLRADGLEIQVYNASSRPNPELTADAPVVLSGEFTIFMVGTSVGAQLWCTDALFQVRRINNQYDPGTEDPALPSDLTYARLGTNTVTPSGSGQPRWYVPSGFAFWSLRRDSSNRVFLSGTNAVYSTGSERKECFVGVFTESVTLSKLGKAYRNTSDEWYTPANSSTAQRYGTRVIAYNSSLSVSDYNAVLSVLASDHGVSTDRREPIEPAVPSYTLPGTVPSQFSRPLFRPDQLQFVGGVRLPVLTVSGHNNWSATGGFAVERDGGTLEFVIPHGELQMTVLRLTMGANNFSANPDPANWPLLSSSYDLVSPFSFGAGIDRVSGVLRHSNGDYFATGNIDYAGTGPTTTFLARRTVGGVNDGPFALTTGPNSQRSGGVCEAPQWFADYCEATTGSTKTVMVGPKGYHSGSGSGGGQTWALVDADATGASGTTAASLLLCLHGVFNSATYATRERRPPDMIPTTEWDYLAPGWPAGENGYWGSPQTTAGCEFIDDDFGHGLVFPVTIGVGRQEYNFQSGNFTAQQRQLVYVQDPGALAAVARGALASGAPRAKWYEWPFPVTPKARTGPSIGGIRFEAGTGAGGANRVYVFWKGVIDFGSQGLFYPAVTAYDVAAQS